MTLERAQELVQRYLAAEQSDTSMMSEEVVFTVMATGREYRGREAVQQLLDDFYHRAFEATAELRVTLISEHHAAIEADFVGQHIGEFSGIAATNRPVRVPLALFYDIDSERGLITGGRVYFEMPVLMAQIAE